MLRNIIFREFDLILSLLVGFFLINFSQINNTVSPYLFVVLLWYPCFELLFSR